MMGSNRNGQLGIKNQAPKNYSQSNISAQEMQDESIKAGSPCLVEALKTFKTVQVSCGSDFTVALAKS